jgi:hypothetical protein
VRELQIKEAQVRSEAVRNLHAGCIALANHQSPCCSQCQTSSLPCHYQEGGKRGLPAAYIIALEKRLADTEAALSAALVVLQNQEVTRLDDVQLSGASQALDRQRSKAEKLEEWKRLPLRTTEQLMTWLQAQHADNAGPGKLLSRPNDPAFDDDEARRTFKAAESRPDSNAHPSREIPTNTSMPVSVIDQLKDCEMPIAPNVPRSPTDLARWRENYF